MEMPLPQSYFQEPDEHLIGACTDIRQENTEYGDRIIFELTPLGETTPRFKRYNTATATSRRSEWQRLLKGLRALGVDTSDPNNIIGGIYDMKMVENTFTTEDNEERTYDVWKPLRVFANEGEAIEAMAEAEAEAAAAAAAGPGPEAAEATPGIPVEILEEAKAVFDAMSGNEAAFKGIAASSWSAIDAEELLAAVKA